MLNYWLDRLLELMTGRCPAERRGRRSQSSVPAIVQVLEPRTLLSLVPVEVPYHDVNFEAYFANTGPADPASGASNQTFQTIGRIQVQWIDSEGENHGSSGSGVMVGTRAFLTSAHIVSHLNSLNDSLASFGTVSLEQDGEFRPYGSAQIEKIVVHPDYYATVNDNDPDDDLAVVFLDRDIGYEIGKMRLVAASNSYFSSSSTAKNLLTGGYPGDHPDDRGKQQFIWQIDNTANRRLNGEGVMVDPFTVTANTIEANFFRSVGGQSGSPLWDVNDTTGTNDVLGILHSSPDHDLFDGPVTFTRITQAKKDWIQAVISGEVQDIPDRPDLVDFSEWMGSSATVIQDPVTHQQMLLAGAGDRIRLVPGILNVGDGDAAGPIQIDYFWSDDKFIDLNDNKIDSQLLIDGVGSIDTVVAGNPYSNAKFTEYIGYIPTTAVAGSSYYVGWIIDPNNNVQEFGGDSEFDGFGNNYDGSGTTLSSRTTFSVNPSTNELKLVDSTGFDSGTPVTVFARDIVGGQAGQLPQGLSGNGEYFIRIDAGKFYLDLDPDDPTTRVDIRSLGGGTLWIVTDRVSNHLVTTFSRQPGTSNIILANLDGFSNGDRVNVVARDIVGGEYGRLPTGLVAGRDYYIQISADHSTVTLGNGLGGTYTITDQGSGILWIETATSNNIGVSEYPVKIGKRDLKPDGISTTLSSYRPGDTVNVAFSVANAPTSDLVPLNRSFDVTFLLSNNDSFGVQQVGRATVDGISSGVFTTATLTLPAATDPFWTGNGGYFLHMLIDPTNTVVEENDYNNGITGSPGRNISWTSFNVTGVPNRPPAMVTLTGTGTPTYTVPVGSPAGTNVATVSAFDRDRDQTLSYAITSGNTNGAFSIDPATGVIRVANPNALQLGPPFELTVQVTDNGVPPLSATTNVRIASILPARPLDVIRPGNTSAAVGSSVDFNGVLYFFAGNGPTGVELWKSDGTPAGTQWVKSFGSVGFSGGLTNANGTLFFVVDESPGVRALWKSDGTDAGSVRIRSFTNASEFLAIGNILYFSGNDGVNGDELWRSDGTVSGTQMVKNINVAAGGSGGPGNLTNVNGRLFFQADDGVRGSEVWISDGTASGTTILEAAPGSTGSFPLEFTAVGNTLYFVAAGDGLNDFELWKSDGTQVGTSRVKDIEVGSEGSFPDDLVEVNGALYFRAAGNVWRSDGTAAGTFAITNFPMLSSQPRDFVNVEGTLYFQVSVGGLAQYEIWKSNGTAASTVQLTNIHSALPFTSLANAGGKLQFVAQTGSRYDLWKSNGNAAGTYPVAQLGSDTHFGGVQSGPRFFFVQSTATEGASELWVVDANRSPVLADRTLTLAENTPDGTVVGSLIATDQDPGQTLRYELISGNDSGAFSLDLATGVLTVANAAALDFETHPTFSLVVRVSDDGFPIETDTAVITIQLTNVNENPIVASQQFNLAENSANGVVVGTMAAADPDAGQSRLFSITGGNTAGAFAIDPMTGVITVANEAALDFESTPSYQLTITATDNGTPALAGVGAATIGLTDVNDAPIVPDQSFAIAEGSPINTVVGTVVSADAESNQTRTFAIVSGNAGNTFTINSTTGVITVANGSLLNFSTNPVFTLTVAVTDSGTPARTTNGTITVRLNDVSIIDDGDSGFSTSGTGWILGGGGFVGRDGDYRLTSTAGDTAHWAFSGLTSGRYRVSATWIPSVLWSNNVGFSVLDVVNSTTLATATIDETQTPDDRQSFGSAWKDLAIVNLTGNTLRVDIANATNGTPIAADAIRLERLPDAPEVHAFVNSTPVSGGQTVSLGTIPLHRPVTKAVTIENSGNLPLALSEATVSGTGFSILQNFPTTVEAGTSATLLVQIDAATAGPILGTVQFSTSDPNAQTFTLTLSATAADLPELEFEAAAGELRGNGFDFGQTVTGTPVNQTFIIRNTGTADLVLQPATLTANSDFTITSNFTPNQIVAPNGSTTLTVRLDATTFGSKEATLSFGSNDANQNPFNSLLSGTVTAPEIEVKDGGTTLVDGSSSVSFGSTALGTPVSKAFTLNNLGNAALTVGAFTLPSGFTLVTPPPATIAAGGTATFTVRLDAATVGNYSGQLSFVNNDSDEGPFDITISGSVVAGNPVFIVDDGDAGFSTVGSWTTAINQGRGSDVRYAPAGSGSNVARWSFSGLSAGQYRVSATWSPLPNRATNSPYRVLTSVGGTLLGSAALNQELAPNDFSDSGSAWEDIATVNVTGSTLVVELSNLANEYVIADAIRIERIA